MRTTVTWQQDQQYDGLSESGHHVTMDGDSAHRGGASPMELVLMALCGCTSVDVVSILRKKREPLTSLTVSAVAERAAEPPAFSPTSTLRTKSAEGYPSRPRRMQ